MLTDMFVMADFMLDHKLFKPDRKKRQSLFSLASQEAVKLKRMVGALRALWRSSKTNGKDERLTSLKALLLPSPNRQGGSWCTSRTTCS